MKRLKSNIAIIILASLGLSISIYLLFPYINHTSVGFCEGVDGVVSGCDAVRTSRFANFLGLPVPVWGIGFYGFVILHTLTKLSTVGSRIRKTIDRALGADAGCMSIIVGLVFSGYLTYLEAFVIHAWCKFCVVQAIAVVMIFAIMVGQHCNKNQ